MVQTRSGNTSTASDSKRVDKPASENRAKPQGKPKDEILDTNGKKEHTENGVTEQSTAVPEKRKREDVDVIPAAEGGDEQDEVHSSLNEEQPPPKKSAREDEETKPDTDSATEPPKQSAQQGVDSTIAHKIRKTIEDYGSLPLDGIPVKEPLEPKPETLLAMVINSMLSSTRISHELAQKASVRVMEAGYHDIKTLTNASWDDKVQVLSEGGYNRYRETTATKLGDLAELVNGQYDGDLNNLLKKAEDNSERVRQLIREIKGFGDVATDLFCDDAQAVWPVLAPTIDHRSLDTAEEVGIGKDINAIYAELGRDPVEMSKLARGLSRVRLSKSQEDIEQEE